MFGWLERTIDSARWTTAWNCVTDLYTFPIDTNSLASLPLPVFHRQNNQESNKHGLCNVNLFVKIEGEKKAK